MASMIKASGRYRYKILEHTPQMCRLAFYEKWDGSWELVGESEFTIEQAQAAKLTGKHTWTAYPKAMLYNRAMAEGARYYCADLFFGAVYDVDEFEDVTPEPVTEVDPLGDYLDERKALLDAFDDLVEEYGITPSRIRTFFAPLGITDRSKLNLQQIKEAVQHLRDHGAEAFQDTVDNTPETQNGPGNGNEEAKTDAGPREQFYALAAEHIYTLDDEDRREDLKIAIAEQLFNRPTWAALTGCEEVAYVEAVPLLQFLCTRLASVGLPERMQYEEIGAWVEYELQQRNKMRVTPPQEGSA